jgi:mRNA-degrading endonuclease RelE of RelBE toxin-antitoxin system
MVRLRGTRERADLFRLRIGDYRAIYAIEDQAVYVTELFPQRKRARLKLIFLKPIRHA